VARAHAETDLAEELAGVGLRATPQRIGVLRALRALRTHPTAADVHRRLLRAHPNLSQKTVYEALDALVAVGLAARVSEGGAHRYEAQTEPHYHARCRVCGRLHDLPARVDGPIRGRTPLPEGFRVERIQVTLEGVCARCRDEV
jgi:Fe2+ or Zn2+ uptake regulation protein